VTTMIVPSGCTGLDLADGTRYHAGRDGRVQVADRHVPAVRRQYGTVGLISVAEPHRLATKRTRWCACAAGGRAWNVWTTVCPRCGAATTEEQP
jgi:hypothetical protein